MKIRKVFSEMISSLVELMTTHRVYRITAICSAILILLTFLLPVWRIAPQAAQRPFIPLHYNIYLGVDAFGPWYAIFILPCLGAALLFSNILFEAIFFRRERVLSSFFAYATVFSEIVLFVAMVLIVLLNV
jgi:hypothetical protein